MIPDHAPDFAVPALGRHDPDWFLAQLSGRDPAEVRPAVAAASAAPEASPARDSETEPGPEPAARVEPTPARGPEPGQDQEAEQDAGRGVPSREELDDLEWARHSAADSLGRPDAAKGSALGGAAILFVIAATLGAIDMSMVRGIAELSW